MAKTKMSKNSCSGQAVGTACEELEVALRNQRENTGTKKEVRQKTLSLIRSLCAELASDEQ